MGLGSLCKDMYDSEKVGGGGGGGGERSSLKNFLNLTCDMMPG